MPNQDQTPFDPWSVVVIALTLVLFVVSVFVTGFTHELLLEAGVFLVFATLDPGAGYRGITAFLVEKGTPGFAVSRKLDKMGWRSSDTAELSYTDVRVPMYPTLSRASSDGARCTALAAGDHNHRWKD